MPISAIVPACSEAAVWAHTLASEATDSGHDIPFIFAANRGGVMLWTIIVFIILLIVLWKYAWGPILKALDEREKKIEDALTAADKAREEATKLTAENVGIIDKAREEALGILAETKVRAEEMRHAILERGRKEGETAIERARKEIELEKDRVLETLRHEMADITLQAASKVIERTLDSDDHKRLAENVIAELEKMKN